MSAIARTRECLEHVEGHPRGAGEALRLMCASNRLVQEFMAGKHEAAIWLGVGDQWATIPGINEPNTILVWPY